MPAFAGPRSARFALRTLRPAHRPALSLALALILALGQVLLAARTALAQTHPQNGELVLKSPQAIVIDADSGAVLYQHNADEPAPASMTRLMVLVMMFKALRSGEIKPDTEFPMSLNAWRTGGAPSRTSSMFVPLGKTATVDELMKGIIIQFGNDAAISVAENMRGNEAAFAEEMTAEAHRLGLGKTTALTNVTGFYDPASTMSVRDLALLARRIIKDYPEYYPLFAQRDFPYRVHKFVNRNPLLGQVPGVDGLTSGYVNEGGFGLVASATQDNHRIIAAVNGAESAEERKDDARRLIDWGFKNFSEAKLFDPGEIVGHARIWGGERMYMPLVGGDGVSVVLPRFPANPKVTARIFYKGPLKPPLKKGDRVATLRVTTANDATSEVPLYAAENVGKAGFVRRGLDSLLYLATRWIP